MKSETWQVDCKMGEIGFALVKMAKEYGWEGSTVYVLKNNRFENYQWIWMDGDGQLHGDSSKVKHYGEEFISIEEAIKRLKTGPPKPDVVLTLTADEAEVLRDIVGHGVNGSGRRKFVDQIYRKLQKMEIKCRGDCDMSGIITFSEHGK